MLDNHQLALEHAVKVQALFEDILDFLESLKNEFEPLDFN